MVSDKFRRQLRREAELWLDERIIDATQYEQLLERYQLNQLDTSARNLFITILIGLGSILIGLGVISFVAANWQELPRTGRVLLLTSMFVGVNIVGFSNWRQSRGAQKRLGHGLLLLGAMMLGANMGLMSQMFHVSGPFHELLLAWGIGVLAMAYSLRLTSMAVMSIILVGLGYWVFWGSAQGWLGVSITEFSWANFMGLHMPLFSGLMFIPLAYWCRSRLIFTLGVIAIVSAFEANLLFFYNSRPWVLAIAFALPAALLWGYDDFPWSSRQPRETREFQPIARQLALFCLGVSLYLLSSYWFWNTITSSRTTTSSELHWLIWLDALILTCLAVIEWWRLLMLARQRDHQTNITTMVIGVFIAIIALVLFWHISIARIPVFATFIFNVLLFVLAAGLLREGLAQGKRRAFWGGMVLLILRILSWFLLSNTELMFKSLVFILCGVGVITLGLWFERYVRTLSIRNS